MNTAPTLSAEEFKTLHNCLWELDSLQDLRVQEIVERIRRVALKSAYEQDAKAFDTKFQYYASIQEQQSLRAVWSIYEVDNLEAKHPFAGALQVAYKDHWGDEPVFVEIKGDTWVDLYCAADQAIKESEDLHHVFIEQFRPNPKNPQQLLLTTGS